MKVVKNKVPFRNLRIGDAFESKEGFLCIKTTHCSDSFNTIFYCDDYEGWETGQEEMNALVYPIQATLTLNKKEEE